MRVLALFPLIPLLVAARDLPEDRRNSYTPGTRSHFRLQDPRSVGDWESRSSQLRNQILAAAGLLPLPNRQPVRYDILGAIQRDGFIVEKLRIETLPGYFVGANLYKPTKLGDKRPAVVVAHGHWKHGRVEDLDEYSVPALCANLARLGYVAIAWDMVGYNDALQTRHEFGFTETERLWSFGPLGLQLWNAIRMVDLVSALPYVDANRIGATGASGGATQTLLLSAVDPRIRASAPVNMVSATFQGGSACENAPGLRVDASNLDIAALMAPRPMLLVAATGDWTRNTLEEEAPQIRRIYGLYNAPAQFEAVRLEADHNYNAESRAQVYRFFAKHLGGEFPRAHEKPLHLWPADLLLNSDSRQRETTYVELFRSWQRLASDQTTQISESELKNRLASVIGARLPKSVESWHDGNEILLSPTGDGHRVPGVWLPGNKQMVLLLHPDGKDAAMKSVAFTDAAASGASILVLDLFQTGNARAYRDRSAKYFLTFNRSDDANRIQDILTGVAFLAQDDPQSIRVAGLEHASLWAVFAAAIADVPLNLQVDLDRYSGSDDEFARLMYIPGVQQAGGLPVARRLALKVSPGVVQSN